MLSSCVLVVQLLRVYCSSTVPRQLDIQGTQELLHRKLVHTPSIWIDSFDTPRDGYRMLRFFCTDPHTAIYADDYLQGKASTEDREKEVIWVQEPGRTEWVSAPDENGVSLTFGPVVSYT